MNILVAGFHHETNTFAQSKACYENFIRGEGWVPLMRGSDIFSLRGVNIPMAGFIETMQESNHRLLPVLLAGTSPSGPVTKEAYERITREIVETAKQHKPDAIYLDLHGAMVAEHVEDGEGELLQRLRETVGAGVLIVASLDLHANVTSRMLHYANGLVAYRTYPHVDMAETGQRAARLLQRLVNTGNTYQVMRRGPFLIPLNGMCTALEPARGMYQLLRMLENDEVFSLSFTPGFPAADFPECGPVIWGYSTNESAVEQAIEMLSAYLCNHELQWVGTTALLSPDEAVKQAMHIAAHVDKPIVIADTQDNPGAGGDSNTMGMLRALVRNKAQRAAIGLIWDPQVARIAHAAGVGATISVPLGLQSGSPFEAAFVVENLSDGLCVLEGPMMHGMHAQLGLTACLKIDDIHIVVTSARVQMLDRNFYRLVGIQPEQMKILVNKSSVHFRADFEPIAETILISKAPGVVAADPGDLPWKNLAQSIRVRPGGKPFCDVMTGFSSLDRQANLPQQSVFNCMN